MFKGGQIVAVTDVVARNLKRFREERGLSIGALARQSGLSKQTIAGIEAGRGNPTVDTLDDLATSLGVSIRALLSEMGTELLVHSGDTIHWAEQSGMKIRQLDQAFGSGYVYNTVLRLETNKGVSRLRAGTRGALRHCYVIDGRARLGPESAVVGVRAGDFVRFPADAPHVFEAVTPVALLFVCTTAPQLSMSGGESLF